MRVSPQHEERRAGRSGCREVQRLKNYIDTVQLQAGRQAAKQYHSWVDDDGCRVIKEEPCHATHHFLLGAVVRMEVCQPMHTAHAGTRVPADK